MDRGAQRINVLWNGSDQLVRARVPMQGSGAILVDKLGNQMPIEAHDGWYEVTLAPASAHGPADPPGYYYVGGDPLLVVQDDVPFYAPVVEPTLVQ